jgi:hypothetical protein
METNLEKAKRLIKAHAAIQGIELPDNGHIFEMLELAATPNVVNKNFIKPDVSGRSELLIDFCLWMKTEWFPEKDVPAKELVERYEKSINCH